MNLEHVMLRATEYPGRNDEWSNSNSVACDTEKAELRIRQFGAAVRKERISQNISQEYLAELAELHRTYISDVERGGRNISLATICRLAEALGLSVETLFSQADLLEKGRQNGHAEQKAVFRNARPEYGMEF